MNVVMMYVIAVLALPLLRVLVFHTQYDSWLRSLHYEQAADFIGALHDNVQFQAFIGGWVFPAFVALVLIWWAVTEEKERIPMQFFLLPLAYIPFSVVGFTLVNAEFRVSYLYVNTLVILTFGYLYVLFWVALIAALGKVGIVST